MKTSNDNLERKSLFRADAIEHVSVRQYGTVLLTQPLSYLLLNIWFVILIAMLIGFLFTFDTTRKVNCQGALLPNDGALRILAFQAGTVLQVLVNEGQHVKEGDVLFILSSERSIPGVYATQRVISDLLEERRDSLDNELKQSHIQLQQRLAVAREKASTLGNENDYLEEQLRFQKDRVELAEQSMNRNVNLLALNYISAAQLQEMRSELLDQRQRLAELNRMKASVKRNALEVTAAMRDLEIQAQRDAEVIRRNALALRQDIVESEARRELIIRAPVEGTVAAIAIVSGQSIVAGTSIASVLPAGSPMSAELYAPSRAIGFIRPGMSVSLRYQAFPHQKFGQHLAVVSDVASAAVMPHELTALGVLSQSSEPVYRVRLRLNSQTVRAYGQQVPLKSGMLIEGSVVLEHRKLYEWILEPLFSIRGRF